MGAALLSPQRKPNFFDREFLTLLFLGFGTVVWDADGSAPSAPARLLRHVQNQEGAVGMLEKRLCWQSRLDLHSGSYKQRCVRSYYLSAGSALLLKSTVYVGHAGDIIAGLSSELHLQRRYLLSSNITILLDFVFCLLPLLFVVSKG